MSNLVFSSSLRRAGVIASYAVLMVGAEVATGQQSALGPGAKAPTGDDDELALQSPTDIFARIEELNDSLRKMGPWEQQHADIVRSMNNLWRQNAWTDEADLYALDIALDVSRIPPWEFNKRMETLSNRMRDRYGLTEAEAIAIRGKLVREIGGMLFRHAGVIFEQGAQYIELRGNNKPFTPELIAEWTEGSEAMWKDVVSTIERVTGEIRSTMDPKQQSILDRDLESFHRRANYWGEKREQWRKGGWRPEDWGMQDDPIQLGLRGRGAEDTAVGSRTKPIAGGAKPLAEQPGRAPGKWLAHDPNTWMAYVEHVAERYDFDEAQRNTGRSLHKDKFDRAAAYANAHEEKLRAVPAGQRATHEAFEPIRAIFAELERQLDAIRTPQQKQKVLP